MNIMQSNFLSPVGWITEIRSQFKSDDYVCVIAYSKHGHGTDYYLTSDLKKFEYKFLEDNLFEI